MIAEPEDLVERPREGEEQRARNPCSSKTGERDVRFKEIYPELGLVCRYPYMTTTFWTVLRSDLINLSLGQRN